MIVPLDPAYLAELATRISFISALLGGFAAAFFATLLTPGRTGKLINWTTGCTAVAAVALVCAAVVTAFIATGLHPAAPAGYQEIAAGQTPRTVSVLCLFIGTFALLIAVALGGWLRSRAVGITATVAAVIGGIILLWAFAGF